MGNKIATDLAAKGRHFQWAGGELRYATDTTNMQIWVMYNASRYAWVGACAVHACSNFSIDLVL